MASTARQWRGIGSRAKNSNMEIEQALTGKEGIDALIRDGFDFPKRRRTEEELKNIVKRATQQ